MYKRQALLLPTVCRTDLHKIGLRGNGLRHVRREFCVVATGISALIALFAEVVAEKQFVVAGSFGAVGATNRCGDKLRVALVKGRIFQDEQYLSLIHICGLPSIL